MSNYNKIFHKVPVEVQNRSGFNKSHDNKYTAKVGTLVPVLVDDVLPNTKVRLNLGTEIQLPPMASDFYGRVYGKFEAFFVPFRLLYGGWQELITHQDDASGYVTSTAGQKAKFLPSLELPSVAFAKGSLSDMLGAKLGSSTNQAVTIENPLSYIAYHKIWDDWYRDSRIQKSCFSRTAGVTGSQYTEPSNFVYNMPYRTFYGNSPYVFAEGYNGLADGHNVYDLRQRNWHRDYFTNATTAPQMGSVSKITFRTDGTTGEFTMPQLFAANALQKWAQINNLAGNRYADQIKAHFGVLPSDAILDRTIYLGSKTVDIYNKGVYTTGNVSNNQQPFDSVATKYANSIGVQSLNGDMLINDFTATEHGFVFVMFSLVPEAVYSTGIRKYLTKNKMSDFAFPALAHMGDQEIRLSELAGVDPQGLYADTVFGYTQRYSEYKYMIDEVHGLMRDGGSLDVFALQRSFDYEAMPNLGSSFLEIPTDYLDQVTATVGDVSKYGCWCVTHFDYKISTPLPAYSIPTLGDLKDTHTEIIDNGGRRL